MYPNYAWVTGRRSHLLNPLQLRRLEKRRSVPLIQVRHVVAPTELTRKIISPLAISTRENRRKRRLLPFPERTLEYLPIITHWRISGSVRRSVGIERLVVTMMRNLSMRRRVTSNVRNSSTSRSESKKPRCHVFL